MRSNITTNNPTTFTISIDGLLYDRHNQKIKSLWLATTNANEEIAPLKVHQKLF